MSNSDLWLKHSDFAKWHLSSLEVIVMLKWQVSWVEMIVRGTVSLFEASELLTHLHLALKHSTKVPSGKDSVMRNSMIEGCWLIIVVVLEA